MSTAQWEAREEEAEQPAGRVGEADAACPATTTLSSLLSFLLTFLKMVTY